MLTFVARRTVYVRDDDQHLWEWLAAEAQRQRVSLSALLARAIRDLKELAGGSAR